MSRRVVLTAAGVLVVVVAAVAVYLGTRGPRGAATPAAAVSAYTSGLAADDRHQLEQVADPDHDSRAEISARLSRFGGGKLQVTRTAFADTESDHTKSVQITGTVSGSDYVETLWLYRHDDRWFVALGPNKNAHPKGT
ncbi:hypothetical protein ACFFWC_12230 [Plantactinospora siamensis]|uniref:DUF4878 domain-containing protein n=1 Tax=Plantactinospora siamensis TaxID=555372 RepID=A0ABV6P1M1_9ACTN